MSKDNKKSIRQLSESYIHQINVLRVMCTGEAVGQSSNQPTPSADTTSARARTLDIIQVAELSGLTDEKEALRFLYILEGHKLVSPFPRGDFTSKSWQVTEEGLKAWTSISAELDVAA